MTSEQHIPIIYCRVIIAIAGRSQLDQQRLLANTNINNQSLKQLDGGVAIADYKQLLANAQQVSGKSTILLEAGRRTPMSAHGPLGEAAAHSPDRLATLHLMRRYITLRGSFNTVSITSVGPKTQLEFEIDSIMGEQKDAALDFILGILLSALLFSPGQFHTTPAVQLRRPDDGSRVIYQRVLGCRVSYGQKADAISFATSDLRQPLPTHDPGKFEHAVKKCQMLFRRQQESASVRESIETVFQQSPGLLWPIDSVAERLNTSARTLQRRLKSENTSYQQVLDGWLKQLALKYLQGDKLSVEATATLLGYHDESNFRRAYKRWFGCAPRVHLHQLHQSQAPPD